MEKKIRTLGSIHANSFSAHLDEVLLQTGEIGKRIRIDHPEAAAVIPFLSRDDILMVRQYRYALGRETLEIPAGKVDPGEEVDDCVKRELLEETGYVAGAIKRLYTYAPAIGYSNELIHIYRGRGLARIRAVVARAEESLFMPATYQVEDVQVLEGAPEAAEVREIVSYEGLYCDLADAGQEIESQGKLESVNGRHYRLVIGTTTLGGEEYIKPRCRRESQG